MKFTLDYLPSYAKRHYRTLAPFLTPAKATNVALSLYEMQTRRTICRSRPFVFRIDPATLCNLRCPSCPTSNTTTKQKRVMDLDDFRVIIGKIRRCALRASLYDLGEPLVNKDIYEMIRFASANNISTLISTNFNLFREEHLEALFDSRLTVLEPCLDGFTQESYEKYRVGGDVETVKNGIRLVMERKRATRSRWPWVDVQTVLFDHISDELDDIDTFLRGCGVDNVTYRKESLGFNSRETTVKGRREVQGVCHWLYVGMTIRPDGRVYPCCGRVHDRFPYGDLLHEELNDIWNNRFYRFSRALFSSGPDLVCDEELRNVPCISCRRYGKKRAVRADAPSPA